MMLVIPNVLSKSEVDEFRRIMDGAGWVDGRVTAGTQSASVKNNMQLDETSAVAQQLGNRILDALAQSPLFLSAALPLKIFPPLFNRYEEGQFFGTHVDNAIRVVKGSVVRVRTDLSATLFLCEPEEYDGGELVVEDNYGTQEVKLNAGDMILYPSTSLHHVTPITRGARICSFFWMQSMVRDDGKRTILFDMDQTIQELASRVGVKDEAVVRLTGIYHNLMRRWADI